MKAIVVTQAGGPEVLQLKETEKPKPSADEVLIKVKTVGVNRSDVLTRKNPNAYGKGAPEFQIPGLEVAGEIAQMGNEVRAFKEGDAVCALLACGAYAEYAVVKANQCLPVPKNLSMIEAASLPETIFTVWFNVFQQAKLQPGEKLLIHGGTSGIGTMGLQMAQALGSPVYTTAGTDEKITFLKKMGIKNAINYKKEKFETVFKDEKIDVILDMVGGDYTQKNLEILNEKGRLVNINGMKSSEVTIDLLTVMSKNLSLSGSFLKPQPNEVKAKIAQEVQEKIWPQIEQQKIKPVVYKSFPLEKASEAHRLMESSEHIGKIVLEVV